MHCNLMLPDATPVALGFNYEAHNSPAYKFNTFAKNISAANEHLSVFMTKFVLRMHRNCYFRAYDQTSDTAVAFGNTVFLWYGRVGDW